MVTEEGMMSLFRTFLLCFGLVFIGYGIAFAEEEAGPKSIASQEPRLDLSVLK